MIRRIWWAARRAYKRWRADGVNEWCKICGVEVPISRDREKYPAEGESKRAWNHRNRRARAIAKNIRNRKLKVRLMKMHGSACIDCGLQHDGKNGSVFHFHHRDPTQKLFAVGNQLCVKAWRTIVTEAAKCDLLCANCHEMRHGGGF